MKTTINYADYSFSPWWGCTANCAYCFARDVAIRAGRDFNTLTEVKPATWKQVEKWNEYSMCAKFRTCENCGKRQEYLRPKQCDCKGYQSLRATPFVLCGTMCDWLDNQANPDTVLRLIDLVRNTDYLNWLLLTKQPQNCTFRIPENAMFGITAENQETLEQRWEAAQHITARKWLSVEPMTGPIAMMNVDPQWVVIGCDSSKRNYLNFDVEWAKELVNECRLRQIPVWVKQLRGNDGKFYDNPSDFHESLRIRQRPVFPIQYESYRSRI